MSEKHGIINCTLCDREFKMYDKKEKTQVYGLAYKRTKTYSQILDFVDLNKSEIDKHICTYCIAGILNKFNIH